MWMYPGMMPILHSSGLMIPGQLGPIMRDLLDMLSAALTLTMSCGGKVEGPETVRQGGSRGPRGPSEALEGGEARGGCRRQACGG